MDGDAVVARRPVGGDEESDEADADVLGAEPLPLVRHGMGSLRAQRPRLEDKSAPAGKRFKDYASGFFHVDVKYLPRMSDEIRRRYLFVAIDRATSRIHIDKSARSAAAFVARLPQAFPRKIDRIQIDNGKEFSDRFTRAGEHTPIGLHPFDRKCGN